MPKSHNTVANDLRTANRTKKDIGKGGEKRTRYTSASFLNILHKFAADDQKKNV